MRIAGRAVEKSAKEWVTLFQCSSPRVTTGTDPLPHPDRASASMIPDATDSDVATTTCGVCVRSIAMVVRKALSRFRSLCTTLPFGHAFENPRIQAASQVNRTGPAMRTGAWYPSCSNWAVRRSTTVS